MEISLFKNREISIKGKTGSLAILPLGLNKKYDEAALKADFLLSSGAFEEIEGVTEDNKAFDWPGEMEVAGISVHSLPIFLAEEKSPMAFVIYIDGFTLCYLSDTSKKIPPELIEKIGDIDLLIFPVVGGTALHDTIEEIEPKAILPLADEKHAAELEEFLKKLGLARPEVKFKLSIASKGEFKPDSMGLFLLA